MFVAKEKARLISQPSPYEFFGAKGKGSIDFSIEPL
jgi:hypothetical protein